MLKATTSVINASQIATPITFAGDVTLSTGNLVIGTAGKGIDFSVTGQPAGMTSELLADYEEGTWTPNQGAGLTVVGAFSSLGNYTRIGRLVTVNFSLSGATSIAAVVGSAMTSNLPFTVAGGVLSAGAAANENPNSSAIVLGYITNVIPAENIIASPRILVTITYQV